MQATTRQRGKGKYTKSQDVIFRLFLGADTRGLIPIKFGMRVAPQDVIKTSNFYRAMHFSAKRGIAIACRLSVRPSVCLSVCL